jgi:hypothetical protein
MLRKLIITSAALAALSTATASGALAMHGGHWGSGNPAGGWGHPHHNLAFHNRFRHHHAFFFRHHRHFAFIGAPFAFGDDCVVVRRVWTPWGWHWRRIWVCD